MKSINNNKKAYFNFEILEKVEAGIVLEGWEVKSIKSGAINLASAYIKEKEGSLYLTNSRIPLWKSSFVKNTKLEDRDRKLLMHKKEAKNLANKAKIAGNTIVPLEVYINDSGLIKILIALVKGKKKFDKRAKLKNEDLKRRIELERKQHNF
jgi:SsrA-binding protein